MPHSPYVAGFDMPGAGLSPDHDTVLVALLDRVPDAAWQQALLSQIDAFVTDQGITQLRLIGTHLHLVGPSARLRLAASAVQRLVSEVSRAASVARLHQRARPNAPRQADLDRALAAYADDDVRTGEVQAVARIPHLQDLLVQVCDATGMRFAAVARVTEKRWTTCAVKDLLDFGLQPGQDLILETTICRELRPGQTTAFGQASLHPVYATHHTPRIYGFESHISVPLTLRDGALFGSLCALDPRPVPMDEATIARVEALAATISSQLVLDEATSAPSDRQPDVS
jgi:hypothetical protein